MGIRGPGRISFLGAAPAGGISKQALAVAQLVLTTTPTDIPGCSLSLGAGTWLVFAVGLGYCDTFAAAVYVYLHLDVGGVDEPLMGAWYGIVNADAGTFVQQWRITLTGTTTVKLQSRKEPNSGAYRIIGSPFTHIMAIETAD